MKVSVIRPSSDEEDEIIFSVIPYQMTWTG